MPSPFVATAYRGGAALARVLPRRGVDGVARLLSKAAVAVSKERRLLAQRHLQRAVGHSLPPNELRRRVVQMFDSYGRYWVDSFRLPDMTVEEIDDGIDYEGFDHVLDSVAQGVGPIVVLPHLGGWEWAGFWLTVVARIPVTVVVEPLEPPELFEFFAEFRRQLGMNIVPLGPDAGTAVLNAIKAGHVVCLLADRDIEHNGVEVEFFGERTTLPAGPATLALRCRAPLLPCAAYFKPEGGIFCKLEPPLTVERREKRLRDDVARITQDLAHRLEALIGAAPEQWHLQQPNWPSDWDALDAIGKPHPRP
ncbi:MAG: phosphatidylinositol mannoside acyltransferase [Acidimicrobiales bacterium]|nr:phosphatidylinositol mannoside acyltransferase [Acidimicrobiales bacterium]